ncbi:MAG: asparagine synthase (glutamine-hydrolyzing) [Candidatus Omnitrophica bacterium]|nr:asparagine synthase (glutamine-hydrolyzing) [Candidatus Omnitrophota bacterium]
MKERKTVDPAFIARFLNGIRQRGPDDEGVGLIDRAGRNTGFFWMEKTSKEVSAKLSRLEGKTIPHDVALLHTRFSIIDLSSGGHQPFVSQDGLAVLIFNGEIYNYLELRTELAAKGVRFRTSSDTEVLVEGWRAWKGDLWNKLNGFWAAVIYDKKNNTVVFSRDRMGVAPLYYRETPEGLFFSSLIDPLRFIAPGGDVFDEDAIRGYLDTGIKDHDGTTFFRYIRSFPAASSVTFNYGAGSWVLGAETRQYWDLPSRPLTEDDISLKDSSAQLEALLVDSVRLRLRADVPVAFELSGGLDSSSVVAAAARMYDRKLTAYTIKVRGKDEEPYARAMAKRYNIDLRVLTNVEDNFSHNAESFSRVMEEPYDTPANYAHHVMLKEMRRDGFKVVLTGAGGDEVLAGYEASFWPTAWREWRAHGGKSLWQADYYEFCRRFRWGPDLKKTFGAYGRGLMRMTGLAGMFRGPEKDFVFSRAFKYVEDYDEFHFYEQRRFHFYIALLPYYLRSTDHYTMNIPVEHRFPFLDYRVAEFGMLMPISYLFRNGWNKYILRQAMAKRLPPKVLWRGKKMGFPFDFENYFLPRADEFQIYLRILESKGFRSWQDETYKTLALKEPERLWRMLSVGIWLKSLKTQAVDLT